MRQSHATWQGRPVLAATDADKKVAHGHSPDTLRQRCTTAGTVERGPLAIQAKGTGQRSVVMFTGQGVTTQDNVSMRGHQVMADLIKMPLLAVQQENGRKVCALACRDHAGL